jgi:two-component system, OmpR family, phosphate regulon sensor histidine kinase PhoR
MESRSLGRMLACIAIVAAGLTLALLVGAPLTAALVALLAGFFATLVARGIGADTPGRDELPEITGLPPLTAAADLMEAIDQPLLIVRNRKILLANEASKAVLGDTIEGADVRLAIRHPAAAEQLSDDEVADSQGMTKVELVGLGERDRRWEMATSRLRDGSRLVRLTDRSEVHASEQMRVDFVANASHELRTPLATLVGFLETLQDEKAAKDKPTRSRFLAIMFDEARRMQQLIEDLISLSRIEAERFSVPRDPVDLVPLVEEIRTSCWQLIEQKNSRVALQNRAGASEVLGDRTQLLQLLRNLIVNALKYGRQGEEIVVVIEEAGPAMVRLSVTDKGEGIAAEHLPRLTERFYRVDPGRSRAIGGTGLGLAIVKHIVGRHRGRLDIDSSLGEGTTVSVLLPRADALSSKSHANVTEDSRARHTGTADSGSGLQRR